MLHPVTFYILLASALILVKLPLIGRFIRVANTMVHESGHAFMALFTSGSVVSIDLFHDTSGAATTQSKNAVGKTLVALSGYVFSSLAGYLLFYLLKQQHYQLIVYGLSSLALLNLIFWVRNPYGIVWILAFVGMEGSFIYFHLDKAVMISAVLLSGVILIESVTSAAVVFYLSLVSPDKSGDAKNLNDITYIPALFWGALFFAQAVYLAWLAVNLHLPLKI